MARPQGASLWRHLSRTATPPRGVRLIPKSHLGDTPRPSWRHARRIGVSFGLPRPGVICMTKLINFVSAVAIAVLSASIPCCAAIPLCGANSYGCWLDSFGIEANIETKNLVACEWFGWSADPYAQGCVATPCESPRAESCARYIGDTLALVEPPTPAPTLVAWAMQALGLAEPR